MTTTQDRRETAHEAIMRAAGVAIEAVREACDPYPQHGIDELQVHCQIRAFGEWCWVDHIDRDGDRLLLRPESGLTRTWYPVTAGETFVTAEPF